MPVYLPDAEFSTYQKRDLCCLERGGFIPSIPNEGKPKLAKKPESTAGAGGCAHQGKREDIWITPKGVTLVTGLNSP